jgi:hypothetical protein
MRALIAFCLLNKVDGTLEEAVEGLAFEHAVLEEGQVDELVNNGVLGSVVGNDGGLLVLLLLDGFLGFGFLVFVLLRQLVVLLLVLGSTDGSQTGFLAFQLCLDGLQGLDGGSLALVEHLLHQRMIGIQHDVE